MRVRLAFISLHQPSTGTTRKETPQHKSLSHATGSKAMAAGTSADWNWRAKIRLARPPPLSARMLSLMGPAVAQNPFSKGTHNGIYKHQFTFCFAHIKKKKNSGAISGTISGTIRTGSENPGKPHLLAWVWSVQGDSRSATVCMYV